MYFDVLLTPLTQQTQDELDIQKHIPDRIVHTGGRGRCQILSDVPYSWKE